jgi:membrane protein implicated in regulation of membrane protease activity
VLAGLVAVAALPAAVVVAEVFERLTLLESGAAVVPAALFAIVAIVLAVRARRQIERTLGRTRGAAAARTGRILGYVGLYLAVTGGIALATYYVLREFAA